LIAVWRALEKGVEPGPDYIRNRMKDYVRKLHRGSRQPEQESVHFDDEASHAPSPYSRREQASRGQRGLDESE
jgi:hypothetical protein